MSTDQAPTKEDPLEWMEGHGFRVWHESLYLIYHFTMTLGFSLRLRGGHNMPKAGPVLIIANHQSFVDPMLVGLVARRPLVYLARKTLFTNRIFAAVIRSMNAVPIDQEGVGKEGLRIILDQLGRGRAVVVFPEGTRTADGKMHPFKAGIHLLIKRTQAPIVPVGIAGAYDAWPIWRSYPIPAPLFWPAGPGTMSVVMGKPIEAGRYAEMPREQAMQELFNLISAVQQEAEKHRRR